MNKEEIKAIKRISLRSDIRNAEEQEELAKEHAEYYKNTPELMNFYNIKKSIFRKMKSKAQKELKAL